MTDELTRIAMCVADRPLLATGHAVGDPHFVSFLPLREAAPLRLHGVRGLVAVDLRIDYIVTNVSSVPLPFDVAVIGYSYRVVERIGREIMAFHWHPIGASSVTHPHLHLSSRIAPLALDPIGNSISVANHHIPTGHVTFAAVVRYLITEVDVEPRRADWATILAAFSS